jgi:hypothetical protein
MFQGDFLNEKSARTDNIFWSWKEFVYIYLDADSHSH